VDKGINSEHARSMDSDAPLLHEKTRQSRKELGTSLPGPELLKSRRIIKSSVRHCHKALIDPAAARPETAMRPKA
jgi:hypothetical protein